MSVRIRVFIHTGECKSYLKNNTRLQRAGRERERERERERKGTRKIKIVIIEKRRKQASSCVKESARKKKKDKKWGSKNALKGGKAKKKEYCTGV